MADNTYPKRGFLETLIDPKGSRKVENSPCLKSRVELQINGEVVEFSGVWR